MRSSLKRAQAWILALALIFAMVPANSAAGASAERNTGVRHTTCTALSENAAAYYTGNYAWSALSSLEGDHTGSSLGATKSQLYKALQTLMTDTQTKSVTYTSLTSYWPTTDTQPGYTDATLFYSDADGSGNNYNREHVWPKSRASFYQSGGGADLHHLRPTDATINSTRSNYTMGNVREVCGNYSTKDYGGKTVLWYSTGDDLVEVNDNIKGDVARIMLYVYVRWGEPNLFENVASGSLPPPYGGSDSGGNNGLKVINSLNTLLDWCREDPVDNWEMARNDLVQAIQGNRNVFIDYPELTWLLFSQSIPENMVTPSGEATPPVPSYSVTPLSGNAQWGTVTLSGSRISALSADGYYPSGALVSPAGAATVVQNGSFFTISNVTQDCTVTVQFAPKTSAAVSYSVPEGASVVGGTAAGWVGDPITLPQVSGSPADTSRSYRFAGWVDAPVTATTDYGSLTIFAPGSPYVLTNADTRLHALYSYRVEDASGTPNTYTPVISAQTDWSGDYVMTGQAGSTGTEYVHLATGASVGAAGAAVPLSQTGMTKQDGAIINVSGSYIMSASRLSSGNYALRLKGSTADCYLSYSGSGNSLTSAATSDGLGAQWQLSYNSDTGTVTVANAGTDGRCLQFNGSSPLFRCYNKGTQINVLLYAAASASTTYYATLSEGSPLPPAVSTAAITSPPKGFTSWEGAGDGSFMIDGVTFSTPVRNEGATGNVFTVPVTGSLAYKEGFVGFRPTDTAMQSGHFLGVRLITPASTGAGPVLTYVGAQPGGSDKVITVPDGTTDNGSPFYDFIFRADSANAFTAIVDLDGTGEKYSPTTYHFNLAALTLKPKNEVKPDPDPTPNPGPGSGSSGSSIQTIQPADLEEREDAVTVTLTADKKTLSAAAERMLIAQNAKKSIAFSGVGLSVTIPVGTLKTGCDVNAMLVNPSDAGNVIQVTLADGSAKLLPFSIAGGGKSAYIAKLIGTYKIITCSNAFSNVGADHWASSAIAFAASHELFRGMDDGSFGPDAPMTRAMLVTILARLDSASGGGISFGDVPSGAWFAAPVSWAAANKIVLGDGNHFYPNAPVSREQLCAVLVRYTEYAGITLKETSATADFSDASAVSGWAAHAVTKALNTGLLTGKAGNLIDPQGQVSRAEFAAMLQRLVTYALS